MLRDLTRSLDHIIYNYDMKLQMWLVRYEVGYNLQRVWVWCDSNFIWKFAMLTNFSKNKIRKLWPLNLLDEDLDASGPSIFASLAVYKISLRCLRAHSWYSTQRASPYAHFTCSAVLTSQSVYKTARRCALFSAYTRLCSTRFSTTPQCTHDVRIKC